MFKLFWVWGQPESIPSLQTEIIDNDEEISDEDVGQVALDVLESENEVYIITPIAWVEKEDIHVGLNKTILTIKWTRKQPEPYKYQDIVLRNSECFWWRFVRNIILPENLALNKIKADMENNMLILTIPKMRFDSKTIKINKIEGKDNF